MKESLTGNQFERVRFFVRFLADLVNARVLDVESIVEVFDALLAVKFELGIPQVCVCVVCVCLCVCLCACAHMCVFPYVRTYVCGHVHPLSY